MSNQNVGGDLNFKIITKLLFQNHKNQKSAESKITIKMSVGFSIGKHILYILNYLIQE